MNKILILILSLLTWNVHAETLILIGDQGKDNSGQKQVAEAAHKSCVTNCDFAVLLGDNVYSEGITSPKDPKMDQMFRKHYEIFNIPFYAILGNHDYGKLSNDWDRGTAEVGYAKINPQFVMPNHYYWFETQELVVAALDTTRLMWNKDMANQKQMLLTAQARAKEKNKWMITIGHHPYLSNGKHGNAGKYEGLSFPSMVSGSDLKKFFDENVCNKTHFYFSGHDHNLQFLNANQKNCNLLQVISGAGASVEEWREKNTPIFTARELGFVKLVVDNNKMNLSFENQQNKVLFQQEILKSQIPLF